MGLHRKSVIIFFVIALLSLSGCKTRKTITETNVTKDRKIDKLVIEEMPYEISATHELKVDTLGIIEPVTFKLKHNNVVSEIKIKDNKVTAKLENKDTVPVFIKIKDVTTTNTVIKETVSKELTLWGKVKKKFNEFALIVLIIVLLIIFIKLR